MAELEQRLELKKEYHLKHWCKSTAMEQKKLCVYCLVKKTNIACAGCEKIWGVEVALCADKCYNEYHEKVLLITAEEPEQLDYLVGIDWEINKICSLVIELEAK